MGAKSQRKGRAGELELARLLQGCGYDVQPGRAVSYGATPDISGLPGIHIECKRAEQLRPYSWLEQAERDAVRFGDGLPAVFFRRSRSPWLVVMKLEDWIDFYDCKKSEEKRHIAADGFCGNQYVNLVSGQNDHLPKRRNKA